jgi:hypothetical protein
MIEWKLTAPVAFLIFNRPDTTARVFAEIARARPPQLLIVADGPRPDREGEAEQCAATRAIVEQIDWDCQVLQNYADSNLGCKKRVSSGLDWVFQNVEEAIVLEDDCLPHPSFFRYCEEMLERYRHESQVMQICGFNPVQGFQVSPYSYYFSRFGPIWGWASWRRAWQHYDVDMKLWPTVRRDQAYRWFCDSHKEAAWRLKILNRVYQGEIDTWDYQWGFAKMVRSGLSIVPHGNLIINIGFGGDSTHPADPDAPLARLQHTELEMPLHHPPYMCRNFNMDQLYLKAMVFNNQHYYKRIGKLIKRLYSSIIHG